MAFAVRIEASGIDLDGPHPDRPIVGFYTTRIVRAKTPEEAGQRVIEMILADWTQGEWASLNRGGVPKLKVDDVWKVGFWRWLTFKSRGHIFFPADE
jgi:hypothetical protein